jgi:hypothetical protein
MAASLASVPPREIKERERSPGVISANIFVKSALGFVDILGAKDVRVLAWSQMAFTTRGS